MWDFCTELALLEDVDPFEVPELARQACLELFLDVLEVAALLWLVQELSECCLDDDLCIFAFRGMFRSR